jgi:hypothetical protein
MAARYSNLPAARSISTGYSRRLNQVERVSVDTEGATIRLSRSELGLVNNALNEVANGVDISDAEFRTRLGESRSDVRQLLTEVGDVYRAIE